MRQIFINIFFLLINSHLFGQQKLTKDEIIKDWNLSSGSQTKDSSIIVSADSVLNVRLTKLIDSLQANNIDSVIVFSTSLPGYISISKCDTGMFPITNFIIWTKDNISHIKKIKGNCLSEMNKESLTYLFDFYGKNYKKIESEVFMPIILSAQMKKDKSISYFTSWTDHEPNYSFYYRIGKHQKSFQFCQSYLDNKKSLFHNYNLHLSTYHWWKQVKQEIDKID
jgi:hypothetical protein